MTKTERILVGVVIISLLVGVFGVLAWRNLQPPQASVEPIEPGQSIDPDLLKPSFIDELRSLEISGNLPTTVGPDETHGEGRNPFE